MKTTSKLPDNYKEIFVVDLKKDTKKSILVNVLSLIIAVVMIVPAMFFVSIGSTFDLSLFAGIGEDFEMNRVLDVLIKCGVLLVSSIAYIVLHELVHGVAMKLCGTKKVKYGFTGLYAFAGSNDYYGKRNYLLIALAPIAVWGIVLLVLNFLVPYDWFWVVYFIQVFNISGASGDIYVTFKFLSMPKDILVHDEGVRMCVYSAEN